MIGVDAENLCFECCYYGALGPHSLCWRDIEEPKPINSYGTAYPLPKQHYFMRCHTPANGNFIPLFYCSVD